MKRSPNPLRCLCLWLSVALLAMGNPAWAAGVVLVRDKAGQSEDLWIAVGFDSMRQLSNSTVIRSPGAKDVTVFTERIGKVYEHANLSKPTLVEASEIAPLRTLRADVADGVTRYKAAAPLLKAFLQKIDELIAKFDAGNVLLSGKWVSRAKYQEATMMAGLLVKDEYFMEVRIARVKGTRLTLDHYEGTTEVEMGDIRPDDLNILKRLFPDAFTSKDWVNTAIPVRQKVTVPEPIMYRRLPPSEAHPSLTLNSGLKLLQVRVLSVEPNRMKLVHTGGVLEVPLEKLPAPFLTAYDFEIRMAIKRVKDAEAELMARRRMLEPVPEPENEEMVMATGTGFFITSAGHLVTNAHVVRNAVGVRVYLGEDREIEAKVIAEDPDNDLALLKMTLPEGGSRACLPIVPSGRMKLGTTVATVGYPNYVLQGFSPKLAKGEIASLAGWQDNPGEFQISVPIQPGNSGGALVDLKGNVVGVVVGIMNQKAAIETTGTIASNVAYAIKSSLLLNLIESVPGLAEKLKEPVAGELAFEDMVAGVQQATVMLVVKRLAAEKE